MNTTAKIAISAAVVIGVSVAAKLQMKSLSDQVVARFPEIDEKIARKAYNRMMLNALTGKYEHIDTDDNVVMDQAFLTECVKINRKK